MNLTKSFFVMLAATAATTATAQAATTGGHLDRNTNINTDHHQAQKQKGLRGQTRVLSESCNFECPHHSHSKPGLDCVSSIGDCKCNMGWSMDDETNLCVATKGLCTDSWFDRVDEMSDDLEKYLKFAEDTSLSAEEKFEYVQRANTDLEGAWSMFTSGWASCADEMEEEGAVADLDLATLLGNDKLADEVFVQVQGRIWKKIKKAAKKIVKVVKPVAQVIGSVVGLFEDEEYEKGFLLQLRSE